MTAIKQSYKQVTERIISEALHLTSDCASKYILSQIHTADGIACSIQTPKRNVQTTYVSVVKHMIYIAI